MSEQIKIDCTWSHLVAGFRRAPCLKGAISERDTVTEITFSTPDGETIVIPEGSKVELTVEQIADMYAIGIEHSPNEFGMTNGPHFDVGLMLEIPPPDSRAVILCFSKDGSERKTHKVDASGTEWEAIAFDANDFIED